jgi:hypothetical protein
MRQSGAKQIAFVINEDLCFVLKAPKGAGMDNPVTIALKLASIGGRRLCVPTTTAGLGP